jgi:ribonucleoside-diphosphate reductase alpha chain
MITIDWLNDYSQQFLEAGYLSKGETVENRIKVIGDNAERILKRDSNNPDFFNGYSQRLQSHIAKGWISLSSPIWSNFGTNKGLPISCFGSYIDDSVESILNTVAEVGTMSKYGGGTAGYFGELRSRGSLITGNGTSNGTKPFLELFQSASNVINQGQTRRGYFAGYIDIQHGDIDEWLNIRAEGDPIQHITWGVNVPTWWMQQMRDGDELKRDTWAKVIKKRFETGLPYIIYIDNANNGESVPEVYKGKGLIKGSQMCVVASERAVTSKGLLTVKELYESGENLTLFDNEKVVNASPMKLIEKNADVYKVTLENGMSHTITGYHKVKVLDEKTSNSVMKQCLDLEIGNRVFVQNTKGLFGQMCMEDEAYLLGLYQSDGTQYEDIIMLDVWENDFDLLEDIQNKFNKIHIKYGCNTYNIKNSEGDIIGSRVNNPAKFRECIVNQSEVKKKRLASKTLQKALSFSKGNVPDWIWKGTEATQWAYVKGLLQADGTVFLDSKCGGIQLSYADINKEFLEQLQLLFANLGLNSKIKIIRKGGESLLPDGKGDYKMYPTKDCWRLYVSNKPDCLTIEKYTGFLSRKGVNLENRFYKDNTKKAFKIVSIDYIGKEDVYCTTVNSNEHLWICNGFVTSNCTEIFLPIDKENSFVCDLASANDFFFEEYNKTTCIEDITYLLDAAMTEFIEKASKIKFLERAVNFAIEHRALGIGRLGYHSMLQSKMIPFESLEARNVNVAIQKHIQEKSLHASKLMAEMFGECKFTTGLGRRNTTLQAIAPTTSSAFILGQVSQSIEPWMSNLMIKDLAKGKYVIRNKYLEQVLESKDKNDSSVWDSILKQQGSVLHLDCLSDEEKSVFKTAREISQDEIILQAAQRQKFIDQGQSLNLFITADTTAKEVNQLLIKAHDLGIKSLYYQHNISAASEFSKNFVNCTSCE